MTNRFTQFFLAQDRFGHRFSLTYEGRNSHQTRLGAFLSLGVKFLVLFILLQKTLDVVTMNDPAIQVNKRQIFKGEVEQAGLVNLSKHGMNIGFVRSGKSAESSELGQFPLADSDDLKVVSIDISDDNKVSDPYPTVGCRDLFADIDDLSVSDLQMLEAASCLDPESATLQGTDTFKEKFQRIDTVLSREEKLSESGQYHNIFFSYYVFDAKDSTKPLKKQMKSITLLPEYYYRFDCVLHNLEIFDNIYSPFQTSQNYSYLTCEKTETSQINYPLTTVVQLYLSDQIQTEQRTRYNFWDLLSDVGGFYEGLQIFLQLLMSFYAATSFQNSFLNQSWFDSNDDEGDERKKTTQAIRQTTKGEERLDPSSTSALQRALDSAVSLKMSFWRSLVPRRWRRNKAELLVESQLKHSMIQQLDIRKLFKMQLDLRLLLKRTLTEDQRKLFGHQRNRLPLLGVEKSSDEEHFERDDFEQLSQQFVDFVRNTKVETDMDRKLLLGVLMRDSHLRKIDDAASPATVQQPQQLTLVEDIDVTNNVDTFQDILVSQHQETTSRNINLSYKAASRRTQSYVPTSNIIMPFPDSTHQQERLQHD